MTMTTKHKPTHRLRLSVGSYVTALVTQAQKASPAQDAHPRQPATKLRESPGHMEKPRVALPLTTPEKSLGQQPGHPPGRVSKFSDNFSPKLPVFWMRPQISSKQAVLTVPCPKNS